MNHNPQLLSVAEWASFAIHPLGHDIEIGFVDAEDRRFILKLHPDALGAIFALTPKMLELALERLPGHGATKQVFGLSGWKVDVVNDGAASVVTLCAANNFKVSFVADAHMIGQFAQALRQVRHKARQHSPKLSKH